MKTHALPCSDAEVSALLAGATTLRRPVTLRNSEGGAYQRALFKLNEAWADIGTHEGRLHGVLKAPVYPHHLDTTPSVEGVVDRLHPRWSAYNDDDPEGRGDALWVLERHAYADEWAWGTMKEDAATVCYRAGEAVYSCEDAPFVKLDGIDCAWWATKAKRWRPASTMPKWAARIWLRVMAVHPERVGRRWYWVIDVAVESTTGRPS